MLSKTLTSLVVVILATGLFLGAGWLLAGTVVAGVCAKAIVCLGAASMLKVTWAE